MAKYRTLDDFNVKDKVVLVRVDFNSEIDQHEKKSPVMRIKAHANPHLKNLEKGARHPVLRIKAERATQITRR
jgi:3-phosphoglycerate kinase